MACFRPRILIEMPAARLGRHGSMQQLLLELAPPPPPTLENFSPGKNGAALEALKEALEDGERFVFLWGPGGSGKTHLLRAFAGVAGATRAAAYMRASNADWSRAAGLDRGTHDALGPRRQRHCALASRPENDPNRPYPLVTSG